jgi:hypothetical protein
MGKRTWTLIGFFLAAYGAVILLVKASSLSAEAKLLLIAGHGVLYMSVIFGELSMFRQHFGTAGDWIRSLSSVGKAARKQEIYIAMGSAIGYMTSHAYLTYFNERSPSESRNSREPEYHKQLRSAMETKPTVSFRRIIALFPDKDTPAKREWVKAEVELANRLDNYQLRFIQADAEIELPLNVQIFDSFVFLIDPSRTNEDTLPRDIHFLSKEIADIWFRYHRIIWDSNSLLEQLPQNY